MHRRLVPALAVALVTAAALTACTGGSSGTSAGGSGSGSSSVDFQGGRGRMPAAASAGGTSARDASVQDASRQIVTTGRLDLVAKHPIAAADAVTRLAEAADGRVGAATEDPSGRASARLQLRIPADRFDDVLAGVRREGEVRDVSLDASDVTAQVTDYGVRIANLRASIDRLRTLLGRADGSAALVQLEGALTERQTSLEQLLAEQRSLADQVAYATLTVSIVTPAGVPAKGPGSFLAGVVTGSTALGEVAAATLVGLGIVLPWLAVLAALGGAAALVRRAMRRRPTSA